MATPDINDTHAMLNSIIKMSKLEQLAFNIVKEMEATGLFAQPTRGDFRGTKMPLQGCGEDVHVLYLCEDEEFTCTDAGGFDCAYRENPPYLYDCGDYTCNNDQTGTDYNCNVDRDFVCHADFDCHDFVCDSGHVYFCEGETQCQSDFTCKNTNPIDCTGAPYSNYTEDTSGDFHCGLNAIDGPSTFDCLFEFNCEARDDFECGKDGGTFDCEGNDFNCNVGTMGLFGCPFYFTCDATWEAFDCVHDFICIPESFTCNFGCYSPPPC